MSTTSIHESILAYNDELINSNTKSKITIKDYIIQLNNIHYNIETTFIDELFDLVTKHDCCIPHTFLIKYKVNKLLGGSSDALKILKKYNFIENIDYRLSLNTEPVKQGGVVTSNIYYLTPKTFKEILMSSRNTNIYRKYYILLEEGIKYYNDFQNKLKEKYIITYKSIIKENNKEISSLNGKLDLLIQSNEETKKSNEEFKKANEKLIKMNEEIIKSNEELKQLMNISNDNLNDIKDELNYANDTLDETKEELQLTNDNLSTVAKKLNIAVVDRVVNTKRKSTIEYMVIMKNDNNKEYKYYVIRGQQRYINKKKEDLECYTEIKSYKCVPNSTILFNLIKERLKNKIICCGNRLNLNNINENEFLNDIESIYLERKEVIL